MHAYSVNDIVTFNVDDYLRYPVIRVLDPKDLVARVVQAHRL